LRLLLRRVLDSTIRWCMPIDARGWVAPGKRRVGAFGRPHLLQLGQLLPLSIPTAPKTAHTEEQRIRPCALTPPSSHLSLSTASTSVMALFKLSTLALLALRAAAVFAAEVNVSRLFCVLHETLEELPAALCFTLLCPALLCMGLSLYCFCVP
jgi:hypothetical protein